MDLSPLSEFEALFEINKQRYEQQLDALESVPDINHRL